MASAQQEMEGEQEVSRENILAFQIPDAPYSDEAFHRLHGAFDLIHGVVATVEVFGPDLLVALGSFGPGLTVLGPLAALAGSFMALGEGYAEARAKISRDRMRMGFAEGFVAGADKASLEFVKWLFWEGSPEFNLFDQDAGAIAQKAYDLGLASGFIQGRRLTEKQKKFFWQSISKDLTAGDRANFAGSHERWQRLKWRDYYIVMAAKFIKLYAVNN
jgi:hypothetical protein